MNNITIKELNIPDIKVIRFERHTDHRGYFAETINQNIIETINHIPNTQFNIKQINEARSFANTFRGLHAQENMGKLLRLIYGNIIDLVMDIRPQSNTFMKLISYHLQATTNFGEWIWIPPGFAHGYLATVDSMVEYICTEVYCPTKETNYTILSNDILVADVDTAMINKLRQDILNGKVIISEKDLKH